MTMAKVVGLLAWAGLFVLPLVVLYAWPVPAAPGVGAEAGTSAADLPLGVWLNSLALAAGIAAAAVVLGLLPGRLLARSAAAGRRRRHLLLFLAVLAPLLLPPHVLYYAWSILLAPTSALGGYLSSRPPLARFIGSATSVLVMVTWYWPLAALVLAQGWRNLDRSVLDHALLDAGPAGRAVHVTLPLLAPSLLLAFAVCGLAAMAEFTTFHLSGMRTIGTELYAMYEATGSEQAVARAAWPMALPALAVAAGLWRMFLRDGREDSHAADEHAGRARAGELAVLGVLLLVSVGLPLLLLVANLHDLAAVRRYWTLHGDQLSWSWLVALAGAAVSLALAAWALALRNRVLAGLVRVSLLVFVFLPAPLTAAALLRTMVATDAPAWLRDGWPAVSLGLVLRYAGLAMVVLALVRHSRRRELAELAAVDGAGPARTWLHVHLPLLWPGVVGALLVCTLLGVTEIAATMVLLPPGLPNFSRDLLNQMHYARDQDVIVSCLALVGCYLVAGIALALLLVRTKDAPASDKEATRPPRRFSVLFVLAVLWVLSLSATGCDRGDRDTTAPDVVRVIGKTGSGNGEFLYPRAIDAAPDGTIFVVDKTGRVQHLWPDGRMIECFRMPDIESGKPVGVSVGPDGNIWIPDTHYNRVQVYTPAGKLVASFGRFGRGPGEFIYPTDVAFVGPADARRVLVSEYGGNDRISAFAWRQTQRSVEDRGTGILPVRPTGVPPVDQSRGKMPLRRMGETPMPREEPAAYRITYLRSFGSVGSGEGEFSRPAAMAVDAARGRLYVADACNHRIAVYELAGEAERLMGYVGTTGVDKGQLRYPYGLSLTAAGELAVCEYGNNRLQFFRPSGVLLESAAVLGGPGRQRGQLAFPWAVAVDSGDRAFVVDAGNNRIQVWRR